MGKYSVGLDLGGTKLAAALVDEDGNILSFHKESILPLKDDPKKVVSLMADLVENFRAHFKPQFRKSVFRGIGLASAGPLNVDKGQLVHPNNFPGWEIVPIRAMFIKELKKRGLPADRVNFQNDAIAAAFAEHWIGGARGLENFALVTIGTGIGTGVIFRGKPLQFAGMGSEFGHIIVQNDLIRSGRDLIPATVEGIASGTGILARARKQGFRGHNVEELVSAIENGAREYQVLFDDSARALAALCYALSCGLNLQKILFSGGLIKVRSLYMPLLMKRYDELMKEYNPEFQCPLNIAKCLNQAGVLGAAWIGRQ